MPLVQALQDFWERVRTSMWLVPGLLTLGGVVLALVLLQLDAAFDPWLRDHLPWLFQAGKQGARDVLSTIAGSTITVAGVLFSITIVVFSLAASQYTSRVLGNFMADRTNQSVLGIFVAIFIYCLIVMRTLASGANQELPALAFLGAMLLALVGVAYLIYFIHHIAEEIQASHVIRSVAAETLAVIDESYPGDAKHPEQSKASERDPDPQVKRWYGIKAMGTGYIRGIGYEGLFDSACRHDLVLRMEQRIGAFVFESLTLISVANHEPDADLEAELRACFAIHHDRSPEQDVAYGIRRLVDIAMKALSPAMNVTTNGIMCVDYLTAILAKLCVRPIGPPHHYQDGQIRVIGKGPDFKQLLDLAFDQIRESAVNNSAILSRQLTSLDTLLAMTKDPGRRDALESQLDATREAIEQTIKGSKLRSELNDKAERITSISQ